jgi:glycosyltransferase involved in cell wall biosynthesis
MTQPLVTIVVPSFNQGQFLDKALTSIFSQEISVEVFVMDGGSTDNSKSVILKWEHLLAGWRSHPDGGQSKSINEGIALGKAPFVSWLNSDDWLLPGGLKTLAEALLENSKVPAVYGRVINRVENSGRENAVWVEPFDKDRLAKRCIISQPASLIRRSHWETINGVDESLHMAMDYDLWWRLFKNFGPLKFVDQLIAVNREHASTKTKNNRRLHYREAMKVVKLHNGSVPLKWWFAQPYAVWFKGWLNMIDTTQRKNFP